MTAYLTLEPLQKSERRDEDPLEVSVNTYCSTFWIFYFSALFHSLQGSGIYMSCVMDEYGSNSTLST